MTTLHTLDHTEDNEPIDIFTHYELKRGSYDPNVEGGEWPSEWIVSHIWYGNTKYPDLESLELDFDDAAREIRSELDAALEYFDEEE